MVKFKVKVKADEDGVDLDSRVRAPYVAETGGRGRQWGDGAMVP